MTGAVSPLKILADAIRETANAASPGVVQVRARGARPATAAHVGPDLVVAPLHALDRDEGLVVTRGDAAFDATRRRTRRGAGPRAAARAGPGGLSPRAGDRHGRRRAAGRRRGPQLAGRPHGAAGEHHRPDLPAAALADRAAAVAAAHRSRAGRGVSGGVLVDPEGQVQAWLTSGLSRGSVVGIPGALLADARRAACGARADPARVRRAWRCNPSRCHRRSRAMDATACS